MKLRFRFSSTLQEAIFEVSVRRSASLISEGSSFDCFEEGQ